KESNSFDIFCGSGWDYYPARVHFWLKMQNWRDWSSKAACFDVDLVAMLLSERINSEGTELQIVKGTK
ncbi:MAG: hypothetical protein PUC27_02970, partial [Clostridium sp.]|nr:hypothetical protein [Clostridium sp.]